MSFYGTKIPYRNKCLVFGYCRIETKKCNIISPIPMLVKYNCLFFANPNKDEFYDKCKDEFYDTFTLNGKEEGIFYQILGRNVVKKFTHQWKFKCIKPATTWNEIGLQSETNPELSSDCSWCSGRDLKDESFIGEKIIQYTIQDGDIIEMNLNCLDWTLSFKISSKKKQMYSAEISVPSGEYRVNISVITYILDDASFKMLSYQMTY